MKTIIFKIKPTVLSYASIVGKKEGAGPYGKCFDRVVNDEYFGEKTWERAETTLLKQTSQLAMKKIGFTKENLGCILSGDLINQCTPSAFAMRDSDAVFFGLYGACSSMAESITIGSMLVSGGFTDTALCATSSHFCTAEKQYRTPLEYGGQRTPTAQWTVTGSGSVILGHGGKISVESVTPGRIVDMGIKDANNMGGAMAPAFADTLKRHFEDTNRSPSYYDMIISGDLGYTGKDIVRDILKKEGISLGDNYDDCGAMIFEKEQDSHSGGSGCGCCASMLCGYILPSLENGRLHRVLFAATGALLSPITTMQGESIPSISHAVAFEV